MIRYIGSHSLYICVPPKPVLTERKKKNSDLSSIKFSSQKHKLWNIYIISEEMKTGLSKL